MSDKFDWNHDPEVIISTQMGIAAHRNESGGITIRQQVFDVGNGDADTIISVQPENLPALIRALNVLLEELNQERDDPPLLTTKPK